MKTISMPDFYTWAENILNTSRKYGTAQDEVMKALEEAFNQGYHLGKREGQYVKISPPIVESFRGIC